MLEAVSFYAERSDELFGSDDEKENCEADERNVQPQSNTDDTSLSKKSESKEKQTKAKKRKSGNNTNAATNTRKRKSVSFII